MELPPEVGAQLRYHPVQHRELAGHRLHRGRYVDAEPGDVLGVLNGHLGGRTGPARVGGIAQEKLITITRDSAGPRRTRQVLAITDEGRAALQAWLATEPAAPRLQVEVLVRTLFATAGSKQDLLAALESTRRAAQEAYDYGSTLVAAYQAGESPFPERLHVNILWMIFVHDLLRLVLDWADLARAEVEQWADLSRAATQSASGTCSMRCSRENLSSLADRRIWAPRASRAKLAGRDDGHSRSFSSAVVPEGQGQP